MQFKPGDLVGWTEPWGESAVGVVIGHKNFCGDEGIMVRCLNHEVVGIINEDCHLAFNECINLVDLEHFDAKHHAILLGIPCNVQ